MTQRNAAFAKLVATASEIDQTELATRKSRLDSLHVYALRYAIACLEDAGEHGTRDAQYLLAQMLEEGAP